MVAIALGTMRLSGSFDGLMVRQRDPAAAADLISAASHLGCSIFDTAPIYARGNAEADLADTDPTASIWTKVGVDITAPLPRLDYSIPGMSRCLQRSLIRLGRGTVAVAFIHNASATVLRSLDWNAVDTELVDAGLTRQLGVSVLDEAAASVVAKLNRAMPVMVEFAMLRDNPAVTARLADSGVSLIVRSIFEGGELLRGVDAAGRTNRIRGRIGEVVDRSNPAAIVVAPRTRPQLDEYAHAFQSIHAVEASWQT
jgi:aryl-alcohol dehydrogenase-like predicted oxidoreductase